MGVTLSAFLHDVAAACSGQSLLDCLERMICTLIEREPARRFAIHFPGSHTDAPLSLETRSRQLVAATANRQLLLDQAWHSRHKALPDDCAFVRYRNEPVGLLQELEPGSWEPTLELVAGGIAILYAGIHARAETALRDPLTGLWNRAHLESALETVWTETASKRAPLSFCLLDIDRFKTLNDTRGHLAGDEVLKTCANHLRARIAPSCVAGRWGGDEFWLILPDTDERAARQMAKRCRADLLPLLSDVTLSVGVATVHPGEDMPAAIRPLIEAADKDLRRKKELSRTKY